MATPPVVAAVATSGTLKPILRFVAVCAVTAFAAAVISGPLIFSLLIALLARPPALAAGALNGPLVVGDWAAPEAGYSKTAGFGYVDRSDCSVCSTFHRGVDVSTGCRSPVYAAGPGTVVAAGWDATGYGNRVTIDHGGGVTSMYGHLPNGGILVAVGQTVAAGDQLGVEGSTGKSTGCHLHFEIRLDGTSVDPLAFMNARGITL
jgi:murein DD-endopeptidase MepM/ murein hydrolase activator NlpD